jgi:protein disulfide-isomerase A6
VRGESFPLVAVYPYTSKAKARQQPKLLKGDGGVLTRGWQAMLAEFVKEASPLRLLALTQATYNSRVNAALNKGRRVFILFNAGEWCPPCMQLKPVWPDVARIIQDHPDGKKIAMGVVDCDKERSLCGSLNIEGFPTMKYFAPGREPVVFGGGARDADSIAHFAIEQLTSRLVPMDPREIENRAVSGGTVVVAYTAGEWCPPCTQLKPAFKAASAKIGKIEATSFDCDTNQQFCMHMHIQGFPTIIAHHRGQRFEYPGHMPKNADAIANWVKQHVQV